MTDRQKQDLIAIAWVVFCIGYAASGLWFKFH